MPSQSREEGESTPDHWMRAASPDLASAGGVTERVGEEEAVGGEAVRKRRRRRDRRWRVVVVAMGGC